MKKVALVTGAASGLGFEFARILAAESYDLHLLDVNESKLADARGKLAGIYPVTIINHTLDLGMPGAAETLYRSLDGTRIDVLVNNAGFGLFGPFTQTRWETEQTMINLHVVNLTHLTKLIVRDMAARGKGRILNMASFAAFLPGPLMSIYYATKAYILSFSQALASELSGTGVTVTVLCPGQTATGFQQFEAELSSAKPSKTDRFSLKPHEVADYGYRAMMSGKSVAVPGFMYRFLRLLNRLLPSRLSVYLVKKIQENFR